MKLNVLVVGAGMYVCGRGTNGYGTILPALAESYRSGLVGQVVLTATSAKSVRLMERKLKGLNALMDLKLDVQGYPKKGKDPRAYKKIILKNKPDCAIVVVPDHLHFTVAKDLIQKGIPVFLVKPLTPSLKEAVALVKLLNKHQVYGAVDFHKRYDEANMKLRDIIAEGDIGKPLYFLVEYSQRKMIPAKLFKSWVNRTDIFQYLGVHYVDLIYYATGARPLRVLATGQRQWLWKKGIKAYDAIQCLIEWALPLRQGTFTSAILTNWVDPDTTSSMSDQKIKVIATCGRYESDQKNRGVQIVTDEGGIEDFNPYFSQFYAGPKGKRFMGYGAQSVSRFLEDVRAIKEGRASPSQFEGTRPTFKAALISTAVVEAANKSLKKKGTWVTI